MSETINGLVSTIIPVFNREAMLREAVASVLEQTWPSIEIIIVDDGSKDKTLQAARSLETEHPEKIRVLSLPNGGPGPAREAGRLAARGEFIQYLDSDDRLLPEKFERQIQALRAQPRCGIAYGRTRLIDAEGKPLRSPYKWTGEQIDYLFPKLLVDRWWCTHTPLYRRSLTDAIGPWTNLRFSQDWEYDARAGALQVKLVHCAIDVSEHRTHDGERQTGHGRWLEPQDRVRFFRLLLNAAIRAGVKTGSPEMAHFARWVFAHSRQCGSLGDEAASRELLTTALNATAGQCWDMKAYSLASNLIGPTRLGRLSDSMQRFRRRRAGMNTLKQSWMEN